MAQARTAPPRAFAAYVAVTAAYWAFMLTDGALRMLVLLHFNAHGFLPVQLAYLFLLYEAISRPGFPRRRHVALAAFG